MSEERRHRPVRAVEPNGRQCLTCFFAGDVGASRQLECLFRPPATLRKMTGFTEHSDPVEVEGPILGQAYVDMDDWCHSWSPVATEPERV